MSIRKFKSILDSISNSEEVSNLEDKVRIAIDIMGYSAFTKTDLYKENKNSKVLKNMFTKHIL